MTKETLLKETDAFLFDLDGTVYLDETPIGDVKGTLARLRAMHKRIVFLTNNSSKTEAEYRQKLTRIGLWGEGDLVYTSAMATAEHVAARFPHKRVYLLATDAVKEEFSRTVPLVEEAPDVVILAYDTTLTFAKMKRFNEFLAGGAVFLATHPEFTLEPFEHPLTGEPCSGELQIRSFDGDCDSMFVARMRRRTGEEVRA